MNWTHWTMLIKLLNPKIKMSRVRNLDNTSTRSLGRFHTLSWEEHVRNMWGTCVWFSSCMTTVFMRVWCFTVLVPLVEASEAVVCLSSCTDCHTSGVPIFLTVLRPINYFKICIIHYFCLLFSFLQKVKTWNKLQLHECTCWINFISLQLRWQDELHHQNRVTSKQQEYKIV